MPPVWKTYTVTYLDIRTHKEGEEDVEATSPTEAEATVRLRGGKIILSMKEKPTTLQVAARATARSAKGLRRYNVSYVDGTTGHSHSKTVEAGSATEIESVLKQHGHYPSEIVEVQSPVSEIPEAAAPLQQPAPPRGVSCPHCNSTQLVPMKKGFSFGKAVLGVLAVGPVGALAGAHKAGSVIYHCMSCGNQCRP